MRKDIGLNNEVVLVTSAESTEAGIRRQWASLVGQLHLLDPTMVYKDENNNNKIIT